LEEYITSIFMVKEYAKQETEAGSKLSSPDANGGGDMLL
jgi:hypothetical protein